MRSEESRARANVPGWRAPRRGLWSEYQALAREEPRARAYLFATLIDDIGVAVSAWANALLLTNLFVTQRARATLMLPTLLCFLAGAIISDPSRIGRRAHPR